MLVILMENKVNKWSFKVNQSAIRKEKGWVQQHWPWNKNWKHSPHSQKKSKTTAKDSLTKKQTRFIFFFLILSS